MGGFATTAVCTIAAFAPGYTVYDPYISPQFAFGYTGLVQGGNCSWMVTNDGTNSTNALLEIFNITSAGQYALEPFMCNLTTLGACTTSSFIITDAPYQQITEEFENFVPGLNNLIGTYTAEANVSYFVLPPTPSQPIMFALNPSNTSVTTNTSLYSIEYGQPLIGCVLSAGISGASPASGGTFYTGQDLPTFLSTSGAGLPYLSQAVYGVQQNQVVTYNFSAMHLRPNTTYDFRHTCYNANGQSPLTALFVQTTSPSLPVPPLASASLCFLFYSLPGNIDYPWSSTLSMTIQYSPQVYTSAAGSYVLVSGGTGTRTYTNRFATSTSKTFTVSPAGTRYANNRLYLGSAFPVDGSGITVNLSSSVQLPGHGPNAAYTQINIYNMSGVVLEGGASRIDGLGSAFLSSVSGFQNVTIGAANVNALSANYAACQAPITFTNGLRPPTQPSTGNGGTRVLYSYSISDGVTYRIVANLTLTTQSAFASTQDSLGNPFQTVVNVAGTRTYTYLPTGAQLVSNVSGLTTGQYAYADQRFYPYALLAAAPGVYSQNTAPFVDYDGIEYGISPAAPLAGYAPGNGTLYNATSVYFTTPEVVQGVLTDGYYATIPNPIYQTQSYSFA